MREHRAEGHRDPTLMGGSSSRLRALSRLDDYEVAEEDPDIRGWQVFDATGDVVGMVHDVIVDMGDKQARYLDVMLDDRPDPGGRERHVLVPIGLARLSDDVEALALPTMERRRLASLPGFDHSIITRDRECELQGAVRGDERPAEDTGDAFYDAPEFATVAFLGSRGEGRMYGVVLRGRGMH